jgi:hypothetical protein
MTEMREEGVVPNTNTTEQLAHLWTEVLDGAAAAPDADFFDCGGTSMEAVYLAAAIQENLGIAVDAIEVVVLRAFGRIAELIEQRAGEAA